MEVNENGFQLQLATRLEINPDVTALDRSYRKPDGRDAFGLVVEYCFNNWLPFPIVVVRRDGIAYELPSLHRNGAVETGLVVFERFRIPKSVKIDVYHSLDVAESSAASRLKVLNKLVKASGTNVSSFIDIAVKHHISRQQLQEFGMAAFLDELDVVVYRAGAYGRILHPESKDGRRLAEQMQHSYGLATKITINDPWKRFGTRFVNIAGKAYNIPVSSDQSRGEGVFVFHSDATKFGSFEEVQHSFEAADKSLNLFATEHEATTMGSVDAMRKQRDEEQRQMAEQHASELKARQLELEQVHRERQHELDLKLIDAKNEKAKLEAELSERAARLKESEHKLQQEAAYRDAQHAEIRAQRTTVMEGTKDYYEHRSYARKDTSEIMKWLPPFMLGVGLLAAKIF